jgi:HSP20 family protein
MTTMVKAGWPRLLDLLESAWPLEITSTLDTGAGTGLAMRMEEFVDGDTLVVRAELPGVDPDKDVEITVTDDVLTIAAERREEKTEGEEGKPGYRSEFRYGSYRRSISLPAGVTADEVTASYHDGILEVRAPVAHPTTEPQKVAVTRG